MSNESSYRAKEKNIKVTLQWPYPIGQQNLLLDLDTAEQLPKPSKRITRHDTEVVP